MALAGFAAASVVVDPAVALINHTGLGEWNTNGDFESWTTGGLTGATVNSGKLGGTGSAAVAQISKVSVVGGPDLNLGFNDVLDLSIQVPAAFAGEIRVYYGSTFATGISASRMLAITNSVIPKDGAAHVYRLNMGLEVPWRGNLTDVRIELTGASGVGFVVDYLRTGDPAGEVYQPRVTVECPSAGGTTPSGALIGPNQTVHSMESKHFRILWNDAVAANGSWTATMAHNTLRNAEECWQLFVKKLGYREPCQATGTHGGTRYKLNITTWHGGYWAGGDTSSGATLARLNITPDGLRENPPTGVLPHELMHCIQMHNTSKYVPGAWWEGHANYGRERYLQHFGSLYPANLRSGIDPTALRCAHQVIAHGRDYYLSWPLFMYLDENPDGLSDLGEGTMVKLWQQPVINEYPLMTLERLTPVSSLKDIVGYFARRQVTFNYKSKADIKAALATFGAPLDNAATSRWQFTDLVQRPDNPAWWRVPFEMAPMQGAYAIHELVPTGSGAGRVVTVNFQGLPDSARGADWRASFIVIADDGTERYSTLWNIGSNSVTLAANENKVYLSVAGAPSTFHTGAPDATFQGDFDEPLYPYRSYASKARFPYEMQVTGATPKQRDNGGTSGLVQHSNGGGHKLGSVTVPASVYIGPNARVLGGSVSGNARIEDYGLVTGGTVNGNAVVSGHAWVRGGTVTGNAKVRDWALVEGGTVTGSARVLEHGNFKGGTAQDLATVKGSAATLSGTLSGNAIIDGDYGDFFSGRNVANAIAFGHLPYVGVPDSYIKPLPAGLYAAYDFATAHDSRILDQYGVTDGFTTGSPAWISQDAKRKGFLSFDGSSQSVLLDRSVADLRDFTFSAWVKPLGGTADQAVLWLGATSTRRLYFTPDDGTGHAKFSIVNGGAEQALSAASALPPGLWSHVAMTLDSTAGTGKFYLNGAEAVAGPITIRPDQLLAANTATALQHNYLARAEGSLKPMFRGALDNVQFHGTALSAADIAAMQPPTAAGGSGTLHVDLRASDASAGAATWINNGSLGNFTRINTPALVTNVLGSGIPGVQFNGTSQAYNGPNSVADIDGSGDRSIEVWVYNPGVTEEESLVSWSYRGGSPDGSATSLNFGSASAYNAVTHWGGAYDLGWGTTPAAGAWHHLAYTYDGATTAKVYVDGVLSTTKTLPAALATWAGQPLNLACQRNSAGGTRTKYFSGYLNTVRVHGGVLTATQIAANHELGPAGAPGNSTPAATPQSAEVSEGGSVAFILAGSDANGDSLTYSVAASPAHGVVSGSPPNVTYIPAANYSGPDGFSFTASDGAAVSAPALVNIVVLSTAEAWRKANFGTTANTGDAADSADPDGDGWINANEFIAGTDPKDASNLLAITAMVANGDDFLVTFPSVAGRHYTVETTDKLVAADWQFVLTNDIPATGIAGTGGPIQVTDSGGALQPLRFYRIGVGR